MEEIHFIIKLGLELGELYIILIEWSHLIQYLNLYYSVEIGTSILENLDHKRTRMIPQNL